MLSTFTSASENYSLSLHAALPISLTVIVLLVSPAAKLTVPEGKAAPTKSDPAAGLAPLPVTAQLALVAVLVLPPRVTVKVNGVLPDCASALCALCAAIDSRVALPLSFRSSALTLAGPLGM